MLKQISFTLLGLLAIILTAIFLIPSRSYVAFIEQKIIRLANENDLQVALSSPALSGLGLRTDRANLAFPKALIAMEIENFRLRMALLSLFTLQPKILIEGNPYEGSLNGALTLKNNGGRAAFSLSDVNLGSHPQISGLGLQRGRLSMQNIEVQFTQEILTSLNGQVLVTDVQKPSKTTIPAGSFGLPLSIEIPVFADLEAMADVLLEENSLTINNLRLSSSLVKMLGTVILGFNEAQTYITNFSVQGEVELSDQGISTFGVYLPLVSQGRLQADSTRFSFSIEGSGTRVQSDFELL